MQLSALLLKYIPTLKLYLKCKKNRKILFVFFLILILLGSYLLLFDIVIA